MRVKKIENTPRIVLTLDEAMQVKALLEELANSTALCSNCDGAADLSEKLDEAIMKAESL